METVLLVAERTKCDELERLIGPSDHAFIRAQSARDARMRILDLQLSLVVVDALFAGSAAKDTAIFAAEQGIDTLVVAPESILGHVADIMRRHGVHVACADRSCIYAVLNSIEVARGNVSRLEEKNRKLLSRLGNEKLLCEAKCLLAARRGMSEAQAHEYIEKRAMDRRIGLTDAARGVVRELS